MAFLEEEDLIDVHEKATWGCGISNADLSTSQKIPIVVCYDLIDVDTTDYNFSQHFHQRDISTYFKQMKKISASTIEELSSKPYGMHFYRTDVRGKLRDVLKKLHPHAVECNPLIFHFGLYTEIDKADRNTDKRSPRIYFMLGCNGMIYPLFFDPYHELNPM